jgi:hypothetical protein
VPVVLLVPVVVLSVLAAIARFGDRAVRRQVVALGDGLARLQVLRQASVELSTDIEATARHHDRLARP